MFGIGIVGTTEATPKWIYEFVSEVERANDFCLDAVYYKEAKKKDYYRGTYMPNKNSICLYFSPEQTVEAKIVLLHEMAHAIQYIDCPETLIKKNSKKKDWHNETFAKIVGRLYQKYGVLERARDYRGEYLKVRKYLKSM
jgi:hypothetical protein